MAVSVTSSPGGLVVDGSSKSRTLRLTDGMDDAPRFRDQECEGHGAYQTKRCESQSTRTWIVRPNKLLIKQWFRCQRSATGVVESISEQAPPYDLLPPTYEESINDLPPDYTRTDDLVAICIDLPISPYHTSPTSASSRMKDTLLLLPSSTLPVDLSRLYNIRSHANKKQKAAQKAADKAKWADSGDEGAGKDGEEGQQNGDDGGGGTGGGAGDGGNGDGNGNGDDLGDWDMGGGKKKKGKKNKKQQEEEEEEKKKKVAEGEDEVTPAAVPPTTNFWDELDTAGDANPDDEWASTSKKNKKGKKGKIDPIVPPPPPVGSVAPAALVDHNFHEINLDAPRLDLDFDGTKNKPSGFGLGGGWGGGWAKSSTWGFGALGDSGNEKKDVDVEQTIALPGGYRGAGSGSKDKKDKKNGINGFDFGLGEAAAGDIMEQDTWGGIGSASLKDKKNKNGASTFPSAENSGRKAGIAVVPEVDKAQDNSSPAVWGFGKKDPKNATKATKAEELIPPPPPAAPEPEQDDIWGSFGKKDKRKGKQDVEKGSIKPVEPAVTIMPDHEISAYGMNGDDGGGAIGTWGAYGSGNKKDKKKKNLKDESIISPAAEPDQGVGYGADPMPGNFWDDPWEGPGKKDSKIGMGSGFNAVDDTINSGKKHMEDDWMSWDKPATNNEKKKGKKGVIEDIVPPPPPAAPEAPTKPESRDGGFMGSMWGDSKKDKKGAKTGKHADFEPIATPATSKLNSNIMKPDEVDGGAEEEWEGGWGFGKKDKKKKDSKKNDLEEFSAQTPALALVQPDAIPETKSAVAETWGMWGSGGKKDKKKAGKTENSAFMVPPPVPTPPNQGLTPGNSPPSHTNQLDDDFDEFGLNDWSALPVGTSKKKASKADVTTSSVPPTKPTTTKIDKVSGKLNDSKNTKAASKLDVEETDTAIKEEASSKPVRSLWGLGGATNVTKAKTAKEKEKERKEMEEKERQEKEETERLQREEEEAELLALLDGPPMAPVVKKDAKKKGTASAGKDDPKGKKGTILSQDDDSREEGPKAVWSPPAVEEKKTDAWGFWGASNTQKTTETTKDVKETKKTPGQKQKEIANEKSTSQKTSAPEPGAPVDKGHSDKGHPIPIKAATAGTAKASIATRGTGNTVAERVAALQGGVRNTKDLLDFPEPPPPPPDPITKLGAKAVEAGRPQITRKPAGNSASKKKGSSLEPDLLKTPTPVPGGFPDDDTADVNGWPAPDLPVGKTKKDLKKTDKGKEAKNFRVVDVVEAPEPPPPVADPRKAATESKKKSKAVQPQKPPSPPPEPEPVPEEDIRPVRKERPRVDRGQGASSWGFWTGSKAEAKPDKKEGVEVPTPKKEKPTKAASEKPALSRSKSARNATDRDIDKTLASSGSDEMTKQDSRPNKPARGMSLSSIFGSAPTPSRSKSTRNPPSAMKPTSRRHSVVVEAHPPSPPADDELQFKVADKAAKTLGIRGMKLSRSKSARESGGKRTIPDPYAIDDDDDMVIADAPPAAKTPTLKRKPGKVVKDDDPLHDRDQGLYSDAEGPAGQEDFTETPKQPPVKRSSSSAKKPEGFMGLFGSIRKKERQPVTGDQGDERRLRRESRRVQQLNTDAALADRASHSDEDDVEAKRAERRAARDIAAKKARAAELADAEARAARRKEKERARRKEEETAKLREQDERRARRAAKQEEAAMREVDDERRRRRHDRAEEDVLRDPPTNTGSRPKDERRRSSYQPEPRDRERPAHPDDRRKSVAAPNEKSRRRSMQVADDYLDPRNGGGAPGRPYLQRGDTDKTASWVHSVNVEPPLPPPDSATVIEPVPEMGYPAGGKVREKERSAKKEPRKSSYRRDRERERERGAGGEREKRSSGSGSGEGRRDSGFADNYGASPPPPPARRGSWLKKIAGF